MGASGITTPTVVTSVDGEAGAVDLSDNYEPLGGGGGGGSVAWDDVTGKPSTFPPSTHTHAVSDVTGLQAELDGMAELEDIADFMRQPGASAEQFWTWVPQPNQRWATVDIPYSAPDTNPDFYRIRNGTGSGQATTPWRLNGNGESRHEPSDEQRFGWIAYEYPVTGSNQFFAGFRTNPSDSGLRETLFGMRGTKVGVTRPGYGVFSRGIETPQIRLNGVDIAPTAWTAPDISGTSWVLDVSGVYFPAAFRLEGNNVVGRGRLVLNSPTAYTGNARICTMPAGCIPEKDVILQFRSGNTNATGSFMTIAGGTGIMSFSASLTNATGFVFMQLDQIRFPKVV